MKIKFTYLITLLFVILITAFSCVDEIPLEKDGFESILVVEATITNENKLQEILLSRSYMFDSIPVKESGATVKVIDDAMNIFTFTETESGVYKSQSPFAGQQNVNYTLSIVTSNGNEYGSTEMQLTQPTTIDNLYVERDFNENNIEGVSVYVNSYDPTGSSKYYRHQYEETYKIIAPLYSPEELISNGVVFPILQNDQPNWDSMQDLIDFLVTRQLRPEQEQICYNTVKSNTIIQENTTDLLEDKLNKYRVHFINKESATLRERYSILVRQLVQSREAFVFYETLNNFSGSESVFSEDQPGFLEGNVISLNNASEKVFGFFEVTSVAEKRVFFNYEDLFPNEPLPLYFVRCDQFFTPKLLRESTDFLHTWINSPLVDAINGGFQFYEETFDDSLSPYVIEPYQLVLQPCGDCTVLGNKTIPDFWEE